MKRLQRLLALSVVMVSVGCVAVVDSFAAKPQDLASRKPFYVRDVKATPEEVRAKCYSRETQTAPFRKGGVAVWSQNTWSHVNYLTNIVPTATGSRVSAYRNETSDYRKVDPSVGDIETASVEELNRLDRIIDTSATRQVQCLEKLRNADGGG